jgi:hypothetical protein
MSRYENDCLRSIGSISEANANLPRKVRFDETTTKVLSAALFVFLIGVIGYTWIFCDTLRTIRMQDILRREGSISEGIVTTRTLNHGGVYLRYRYEVDGIWYFGQAEMKAAHYKAPALGETIHVLYLPNKPNVSLPSSWEWFSMWDIVPFVFLLFTTIASGVVITETLRERQLARIGVVVEGRVTGCAPDKNAFTVYYEFTTENNALIEGSEDTQDEIEVGTPIPIIYLRHNPKRNSSYPLSAACEKPMVVSVF